MIPLNAPLWHKKSELLRTNFRIATHNFHAEMFISGFMDLKKFSLTLLNYFNIFQKSFFYFKITKLLAYFYFKRIHWNMFQYWDMLFSLQVKSCFLVLVINFKKSFEEGISNERTIKTLNKEHYRTAEIIR